MAGIGIPSVITSGGQITWNDKVFDEIFFEVDWKDINQVVKQISKASSFTLTHELHNRLTRNITIDNELAALQH
jgi:hypothetical protein